VAIVNKNIIEDLFRTTPPIGERVTYNNKEYTIIGTIEDSSMIGMVFIPITTYQQRITGKSEISNITVKLPAEESNSTRMNRLNYFLLRKYNIKHLDLAGFSLSSTVAAGNTIDDIMKTFSIFL
jgi:hypothetical protein